MKGEARRSSARGLGARRRHRQPFLLSRSIMFSVTTASTQHKTAYQQHNTAQNGIQRHTTAYSAPYRMNLRTNCGRVTFSEPSLELRYSIRARIVGGGRFTPSA